VRWVWLSVVTAGCSFSHGDAPRDGAIDGPVIDGRVIDGRPIDGRPIDAEGSGRMKVVTIAGSSIAGVDAAFPVYLLDASDPELAARAQADGSDIYFTQSDGTPLDYEIQRWDHTTGHLEAWIKLDLASGTTTVFQLRYGDPAAAQAANPKGVFASSYLAVWHLDDALTSTQVVETLGNATGTAAGSLGPAGHVAGQLGYGIKFDGVANEVTFTNPLTGAGSHTISAWVNVVAPASGFSSILTIGDATTDESRWFHTHFPAVAVGFFGNDWTNTGVSIEGAGWTMIDWVYDSSTRVATLYVNGALAATSPQFAAGIATTGTGGHIGNAPMPWGPGGDTTNPLDGVIDELRIATTTRSASWIQTEYADQSAPASFCAIGSEQALP